ncbi:MAG: LapA family protein [Gammaproteobacteria bacterium]|nr:LapA family protein [Gammaproteobacteria bacterium]
MKLISTVIITTIILIAILFSVLNAEPVSINYYFGELTYPLSLLMVLVLAIGIFSGILASMVLILKLRNMNAKLKKEISESEKELINLRRLPLKDIK